MSPDQRPRRTAGDVPPASAPEPAPAPIDRRTMVRRSAVVLAGTAGILAAPALLGKAVAEPGDSLRLGGRNRAEDAQTRLQSSTTVATLSVLNEHVRRQEADDDVDLVAAQLRLEGPVAGAARPQVPDVGTMAAGDLAAAGGLLYFGAEAGDFDVVPSQVFTSYFANYLHPVPPRHATVLDTRTLTVAGRSRFAPADLDGAGRLVADRRIAVDLRVLVNTTSAPTRAAVALSLQIFDAAQSGVLSVYPDSSGLEGVNVLAYAVLPAAVTANGAALALPASGAAVVGLDTEDRLWLSVSGTAHIVVQVTGLFVPDPTAVVDTVETLLATSPYARRVQRQRRALRRLTAGTVPDK